MPLTLSHTLTLIHNCYITKTRNSFVTSIYQTGPHRQYKGVYSFSLIFAFLRFCSRQILKTLWQKEELLIMSNIFFVTMFLILLFYHSFIYRELPYFIPDAFKVLCCRLAVCGKGITKGKITNNTNE